MHNVASPPDSDVLLVSGGGRFLRIKKKNFFHVCSREGLDHARRIATSVRFVGIFMIIYILFFSTKEIIIGFFWGGGAFKMIL